MAAPMSYETGGEQYVAVMAGYGGAGGFSFTPDTAAYRYGNAGRIVAFRLGGTAVPKPAPVTDPPFAEPPARRGEAAAIARGELLYARHCSRCHAFGRGLLPDLRRSSPAVHELFGRIVLEGAFAPKGMGRFDDVLSAADAAAIQSYVIDRAWQAWDAQQGAAGP